MVIKISEGKKERRPVGVVLNESMSYSVIFVSKHLCGVCREEFVIVDIFFQWRVWCFIKFTFHKLTRKGIGTSKFCQSSRLLKGTFV